MTVSGRRVVILTMILLSGFIASAQDFKRQVIYQIITDRFVNGSTANDNPPQSAGLFDSTKTNWRLYWGGDLTGIQQTLSTKLPERYGCDRNLDLAASGQSQSKHRR